MTVQQIVWAIISFITLAYKKPAPPAPDDFQPIAFLPTARPDITRARLTGFDLSRIFYTPTGLFRIK